MTSPAAPVPLFCGYHPEDRKFFEELHSHLAPLVNNRRITIRDPDSVPPGAVRRVALEKEISEAGVIVLLVSEHIMSGNDWCALLKCAADAEDAGLARLVPIRVRSVDVSDTPLAGRTHLPRDPAPPLDMPKRSRSTALVAIAKEIRQIIDKLQPLAPSPDDGGAAGNATALAGVESRKEHAYGLKYRGRGKEALEELHLALKELDALIKNEPEPASSKKERAHLYDRIAQCEYAQGRFVAARAAFDRAFAIRSDLCLSDPGDADALFDLSTSRFWRGYLSYLQGDLRRAQEEQHAGLEACQNLYKRDPGNLKAARSLVVLQTDLGTTLWELDDVAGAERHLRGSLVLVRQLAAQNPDNLQLRRDLSVGLFRLADLLVARSKTVSTPSARGELTAEATRLCEESIRMCWALTEGAPTNVQWRRHLATARISMGDVRLSCNDLALARGDYEFATGTMGALAALEREDLQGARHHARSEKRLGDLLHRAGDHGGAMAALTRAASAMKMACAGEVSERWKSELHEIHTALSRASGSATGEAPNIAT